MKGTVAAQLNMAYKALKSKDEGLYPDVLQKAQYESSATQGAQTVAPDYVPIQESATKLNQVLDERAAQLGQIRLPDYRYYIDTTGGFGVGATRGDIPEGAKFITPEEFMQILEREKKDEKKGK